MVDYVETLHVEDPDILVQRPYKRLRLDRSNP